ncbi:uncharacterized protein LOC115994691 [Quercus lobata]|uniref:uncharacterized protein LOC115994691 n=1 Tax=Quercus lobata TaxID=97700 RepID=UPI0012481D8C|nr:uncharacterized protein LOC115994691 [Quercus lobata]
MVLTRYDKDTTLKASELKMVPFWIQIYDIPLRFRHKAIAEQICQPLGAILTANDLMEYDGGSFIRVRVMLDISQPLCRGRLITLENGKKQWVSFKYKRLPNLCYWCGCLTHDDRDCATWLESEGTLNSDEQQFGAWLRAPPFNSVRKKVVSVPGFFAKKKVANPASPGTEPPPFLQATVHTATVEPCSPPPRALNENPVIQGVDSDRVSTPTHHVGFQKSEEILAPVPPKLADFEKTLRELDRDIHGFEKDTVGESASNVILPATAHVHSPQSSLSPSPDARNPPVQRAKPIPLNDRTNMAMDQSERIAQPEGKWLRIQRPKNSNDTSVSNVVLGKRSPLSSLASPIPSKRRALNGDALEENVPPSAEAALQPRRGR